MKEFKEGDKVFDLRHGNGVVIFSNEYDVIVKFRYHSPTYNFLGKWMDDDDNPTLFHGHDLIIEVKEPEYEWQIIYQKTAGIYGLSEFFYKKLIDFNQTGCLFEPSKRLVKRG